LYIFELLITLNIQESR